MFSPNKNNQEKGETVSERLRNERQRGEKSVFPMESVGFTGGADSQDGVYPCTIKASSSKVYQFKRDKEIMVLIF